MSIGRTFISLLLLVTMIHLIHGLQTDPQVVMARQLRGIWINNKEEITFEFKDKFLQATPVLITTKKGTIIGEVSFIDKKRIRVDFVERGFFNIERKTEIFDVDIAANTLALQSGPDKIILHRIQKNLEKIPEQLLFPKV